MWCNSFLLLHLNFAPPALCLAHWRSFVSFTLLCFFCHRAFLPVVFSAWRVLFSSFSLVNPTCRMKLKDSYLSLPKVPIPGQIPCYRFLQPSGRLLHDTYHSSYLHTFIWLMPGSPAGSLAPLGWDVSIFAHFFPLSAHKVLQSICWVS